MVRKLYKHEFAAWLRVMPFFWVAMLGVAAAGRFVQFFEKVDSVYYWIIFGSSLLTFFLTALVLIAAPTVFGMFRFYRNLFTGEGYLSFTLPVSPGQHLLVKVTTALCFQLISLVVLLLSGCVLTFGDMLVELLKAGGYLLKQIPKDILGHIIGYIVQYAFAIVVGAVGTHLMYYSCICIGQLFRKGRILWAVGVYFIYQMIAQVFSTGISLLVTLFGMTGAIDKLVEIMDKYPFGTLHVSLGISGLIAVVVAVVLWLVCHIIIRKRLNLE